MENKKGQQILVGVMLAFIVFVSLVAFISPVKSLVDDARNSTNCESSVSYNVSIATDEMSCLMIDFWLPAYFGVGLAIAIGAIGYFKTKKEQ